MSNPPAGWYPDPTGQPNTIRWWNGEKWTNKTEHKDASAPAADDADSDSVRSASPQSARPSGPVRPGTPESARSGGSEHGRSATPESVRSGAPESVRSGPEVITPQWERTPPVESSVSEQASEQAGGWWQQPAIPQLWDAAATSGQVAAAGGEGPRLRAVAPDDGDNVDGSVGGSGAGPADERIGGQSPFERARATWGAPEIAPAPAEHWTQRDAWVEPEDEPLPADAENQTNGPTLRLAPLPLDEPDEDHEPHAVAMTDTVMTADAVGTPRAVGTPDTVAAADTVGAANVGDTTNVGDTAHVGDAADARDAAHAHSASKPASGEVMAGEPTAGNASGEAAAVGLAGVAGVPEEPAQSWSDVSWTAPPTFAPKPKDEVEGAGPQVSWAGQADEPTQVQQHAASYQSDDGPEDAYDVDESARLQPDWGVQSGDELEATDEPIQVQPAWGVEARDDRDLQTPQQQEAKPLWTTPEPTDDTIQEQLTWGAQQPNQNQSWSGQQPDPNQPWAAQQTDQNQPWAPAEQNQPWVPAQQTEQNQSWAGQPTDQNEGWAGQQANDQGQPWDAQPTDQNQTWGPQQTGPDQTWDAQQPGEQSHAWGAQPTEQAQAWDAQSGEQNQGWGAARGIVQEHGGSWEDAQAGSGSGQAAEVNGRGAGNQQAPQESVPWAQQGNGQTPNGQPGSDQPWAGQTWSVHQTSDGGWSGQQPPTGDDGWRSG